MKRVAGLLVLSGLTANAFPADPQMEERGRKAEQQSCRPCHSLRLIESQRLSSAAWGKELDKMIGWGAIVPDKQLLLDYLSEKYSDARPVPRPEMSGDCAKRQCGPGKIK